MWLEFELTNNEVAALHFSHYVTAIYSSENALIYNYPSLQR